jgi:gamma-glutamylcyclotransferase (GGCT)/AIG2-like uncharacterized protein YtfP
VPKVFVYGTLMSGQPLNFHLVRGGGFLLGEAATEPFYHLYRIGWWGATPARRRPRSRVRSGRIRGTVWPTATS